MVHFRFSFSNSKSVWLERAGVLFLLALIALQALGTAQYMSLTVDETAHLPAGYSYWRTGDFRLGPENPPLIKLIAAFPLLLLNPRLPLDNPSWQQSEQFAFGKELLFHSNRSPGQLIFWGRVPTILLSLLLAFFVFKWAREIYGRRAGLFALFLYAFEPNISAHSSLATLDLGLACFTFIATYYFWRFLKKPSAKGVILAGAFLGLALSAKFSALLLLPAYLILILVTSRRGRDNPSFFRFSLGSCILILLVSFFVIYATYGFHAKPLLASKGEHARLEKIIPLGRDPASRFLYSTLEKAPLPLVDWLKGLLMTREHSKHGHAAFLMGKYSTLGWWHYHLFAFLIKTPIPLLFFLLLALSSLRTIVPRDWADEAFLLIPVSFFLLASFFVHINIGLRYILPIYPFLFVFASRIINQNPKQQSWYKAFLSVLAIWYIMGSAVIYPHYLAYFNESIGGPRNAYRYLVDSNLDWGQDLKGLSKYMKEKGIRRIKLSYFGTAIPESYGISYEKITKEEAHRYSPGIYAISVTSLQNVYDEDKSRFAWLKKHEPVAKIGYSIFIYDVRKR